MNESMVLEGLELEIVPEDVLKELLKIEEEYAKSQGYESAEELWEDSQVKHDDRVSRYN